MTAAPLTAARLARLLLAGLALCAAAAILGLMAGSSAISPAQVLAALVDDTGATSQIVRAVRLPSVAVALLVGATLGTGGAAMQALLRNPLADPWILGISGGAALGAATALLLAPALTPAAAFAGAAAATAALYAVAAAMPGGLGARTATVTLLLAGVVFNALASSVVLVLHTLVAPARSRDIILWLMGSLAPGRLDATPAILAGILGIVAIVALTAQAHRLNVLALGDDEAAALGVDVGRARAATFLWCALAIAVAVTFAGLVGFVGLVVPHLVRLATGADHRVTVPLSALVGAAFLCLCDATARALFVVAGTSLPVGAITALVGAPLFLVVLVRAVLRQHEAP